MGPLDGIRVVEVAGLAAAPFGCMMLADLGADVLRVDRVSSAGRPAPDDPLGRGRRSIALDLKTAEGTGLRFGAAAQPACWRKGSARALPSGWGSGLSGALSGMPGWCTRGWPAGGR